jgi:hypothetical protein
LNPEPQDYIHVCLEVLRSIQLSQQGKIPKEKIVSIKEKKNKIK